MRKHIYREIFLDQCDGGFWAICNKVDINIVKYLTSVDLDDFKSSRLSFCIRTF